MVNVSKQKIKKETLAAINDQLVDFVADLETPLETKNFLDEILTSSEKIQLAKRFAIIVMLERGYMFDEITSLLKVSPSTVSKIQLGKSNGRFKEITEHIDCIFDTESKVEEKESYTALRAYIDTWLLPLPPIAGRGRWRNLQRMDEIDRKRQEYKERKRGL